MAFHAAADVDGQLITDAHDILQILASIGRRDLATEATGIFWTATTATSGIPHRPGPMRPPACAGRFSDPSRTVKPPPLTAGAFL